MRVSRWAIGICATFIGWGALMGAENPGAAEAIKNRIANFREIGTAFKAINDELKSAQPYLPSIQESARQIDFSVRELVDSAMTRAYRILSYNHHLLEESARAAWIQSKGTGVEVERACVVVLLRKQLAR